MEDTKRSIFRSPVLYSAIFAVIICGVSYYYISYKPNKASATSEVDTPEVVVTATNETDSDKDGLPDWKEAVYGSNPSKQDTDGDGVSDGAEIAIGHDPTKKGPDDILHNISLGNSTSSANNDLEQTFVAEFMSKEIENIRSETVTDLIKKVDTSQIKPRYNLTNLNVTSDNSPEALKNYANSFGIIMKKYYVSGVENEATIVARAIKSKSNNDLQKIELPAITYRNFSEDLKKLETPSILAEHHLNIVSGYDVMSRSLFLTEKLFTNPIEGSAGWQAYLAQMVTVTRGYAGVINVLHDKHIEFDKTDAGYYFTWRGEMGPSTSTQMKTTSTPQKTTSTKAITN